MAKKKDMNRSKLILLIMLIASLALLANTYITKVNLQKSTLVDVVVAKTDIRDGLVLTEDMITIAKIPQGQVLTNVYDTQSAVIGKTVIVPIYTNEQILSERLTETISTPTKNNWIIQLNSLDKALDLRKGSFVDLWLTPTSKGFEQGKTPQILLSGIKIQDVKNEAFNNADTVSNQAKDNNNQSFIPEYIVLNLDEAELKAVNNINQNIYNFRLAKYNEALLYNNLTESGPSLNTVLEEKEDSMEEEIATDIDNTKQDNLNLGTEEDSIEDN